MNDKGVAPRAALAGATYRKSSRSTAAGNCVEIADLPSGYRAVRDSKDVAGPILTFGPSEWGAFTAAIRTGDFR
ncbi:MAG: DUF397 domain-containing protein [Pseudonocardiales bacterium]|jgi:uncharacterized heparinase superfamily protein|nr:DUF397 domain-containing protein [Pseudonocardiales bacterium]MBV9648900.1 DUF397 domain-containing protein [Pseudonocardiales bacterium]